MSSSVFGEISSPHCVYISCRQGIQDPGIRNQVVKRETQTPPHTHTSLCGLGSVTFPLWSSFSLFVNEVELVSFETLWDPAVLCDSWVISPGSHCCNFSVVLVP